MSKKKQDYILLDHTADLGIKVRGKTLENLFENAAKAMIELTVRGKSEGKIHSRKIVLSGQDLADLMVQWLGEILYLFEGEKLVATSAKIDKLSPSMLEASVEAVPFDPEFHVIINEIKAVTYHQSKVLKKGDHYESTIIFDL
ncbi:MAG: archease [Deltaproteobacteria bacterium]|nr:archease [Deltaproteobacteria bacterium]MBW1921754.1 archease [Deltaproteobacteria bacterium]MBW1936743.1 archease [Deltaproteobacteria bacterium]MBW1978036.1 archease [Deltaproteobacteria bacterium]MBW2045320.1 archease [Deltaproteobacteria bacterium]